MNVSQEWQSKDATQYSIAASTFAFLNYGIVFKKQWSLHRLMSVRGRCRGIVSFTLDSQSRYSRTPLMGWGKARQRKREQASWNAQRVVRGIETGTERASSRGSRGGTRIPTKLLTWLRRKSERSKLLPISFRHIFIARKSIKAATKKTKKRTNRRSWKRARPRRPGFVGRRRRPGE